MNTIPTDIREFLENIDNIPGRLGRKDISVAVKAFLAQYPEPKPAPAITSDTPVNYANDTIREHAEHLARNEVYYCVSSLVHSVAAQVFNKGFDGVHEDETYSITRRDDWETPAREHLAKCDTEELYDIAEYVGVELGQRSSLHDVIIEHCEENSQHWAEICDYCRLDPDTIEAYEHWIVSDYLARQLESEGEMIARDFLGLTIWGRTTTGQSISMDYVMLKIARDALAR